MRLRSRIAIQPKRSRRRSRPRLVALVACAAWLPALAAPNAAAAVDSTQRRLALEKLSVLGSVLYVGAHPDDENTAMLAYLSEGRKLRTAYLSMTRGAGGQNLIGTEQGDALGVLRTEELLAARWIDGAEQFFTRALDFGYSKSAEESLQIWGHDAILADVVRVIRTFRPDVIITRFAGDGSGGHGHHTASAILAREAFSAAADPTRFPEQLATLKPWQAKRILWNAWRPRIENRPAGAPRLLSVDLGAYDPLLGESYTEIAARARSMHKSQGFGSSGRRGAMLNYLQLMDGAPATRDFMEGIDTTWNRIPGGAAVAAAVAAAQKAYDSTDPSAAVPALLDVLAAIDRLAPDPWVEVKRAAVKDLIRDCTGLWLDATGADGTATPGETVTLTATAINRSPLAVTLVSVAPPFGPAQPVGALLSDNLPVTRDLAVSLPADLPTSGPYWLAAPHGPGRYVVRDERLIGLARAPAPLRVAFVVSLAVPVEYRWTDPVQGEQAHRIEIVPAVTLDLGHPVILFPSATPRRVDVRVTAQARGASGIVRLDVPAGWSAAPPSRPFTLAAKGDERDATFTVTPPSAASTATLTAVATVNGRDLSSGMTIVAHPHIPTQTLLPPAQLRLVRADVRTRGSHVGYVMGPGDDVPEALRQMGYRVELLTDEQLESGDLSAFDAIVVGVRAYNTRPALTLAEDRLLAYVEGGGVLVVQYNKTPETVTDRLGPYPLTLSRTRVTDEHAPVAILIPDQALLTTPNRIGPADFDGWIQERGIYFPQSWDAHYQAPLAMADPGEPASSGSLLTTTYGKGVFVYTGLVFFRELPAGVAGAYRLFANLVAGGRSGA
jgi:LmbE family N-acetylglucosaminyl deacetylase